MIKICYIRFPAFTEEIWGDVLLPVAQSTSLLILRTHVLREGSMQIPL